MILSDHRKFTIGSPAVGEFYGDKTPILRTRNEADGKTVNVSHGGLKQSLLFDKLSFNSALVRTKQLLAIETVFKLNNEEYHTVLQKKGNEFLPTKMFKMVRETLKPENNIPVLKHGKDGVFYKQEDLKKIITTLLVKNSAEQVSYLGSIGSIKSFLENNTNLNDFKAKVQKEFNIYIHVNNIEEWAKNIQALYKNPFATVEEMKADLKDRISIKFPYAQQEDIVKMIDTFTELLETKQFAKIDADMITSVKIQDIPLLKRIESGNIVVSQTSSARIKMLSNYLENSDLEILRCNAGNYILGLTSDTNVPVFYESTIYKESEKCGIEQFNEREKVADKRISAWMVQEGMTGTKLLQNVIEENKDDTIYVHAYLKRLKNKLHETTKFGTEIDEKAVKARLLNIESFIKSYVPSGKDILDKYFKEDADRTLNNMKNTVLKVALSMTKSDAQSELRIAPTTDGKRIHSSKDGQRLNIDYFYNNNMQIAEFAKSVGLKKDGDSIISSCGLSLVGITDVVFDEENTRMIPQSMQRFSYSFSGYEEAGNIIDRLSKIDSNSQITYLKKNEDGTEYPEAYTVNLDKNIEALNTFIRNAIFIKDSTTGELTSEQYITQKGVATPILEALNLINQAFTNNETQEAKIESIQKLISSSLALKQLKEIGEMVKPDFDKKQSLFYAQQNISLINSHIAKYKEDLLEKKVEGKYYVPKSGNVEKGKKESATSVMSTLLNLERNLKKFAFTYNNDRIGTPKAIVKKVNEYIKANPDKQSYYATNDAKKIEEFIKDGNTTIGKLTESIAEMIASKYSVSLPPKPNFWVKTIAEAQYYPKEVTTVSKGRDFKQKTTTYEDYFKLVETKQEFLLPELKEMNENISERYAKLKESFSAPKVATILPMELMDDIEETQEIVEEKENTITITVEDEIPILPVELLEDIETIALEQNNQHFDGLVVPNINDLDSYEQDESLDKVVEIPLEETGEVEVGLEIEEETEVVIPVTIEDPDTASKPIEQVFKEVAIQTEKEEVIKPINSGFNDEDFDLTSQFNDEYDLDEFNEFDFDELGDIEISTKFDLGDDLDANDGIDYRTI